MKEYRSKRSAFRLIALAVVAAAIFVFSGIGQPAFADGHEKKKGDIVDTAVAAGSFKTLAAALKAADLVDALKGDGPFTVFAPTDEAFAKIPASTLNNLLKPENKEKLRAILLYHVVSGKVPASTVLKLNGQAVETLQGSKVMVNTKHGVMVNNARVVKTDIMTSNGIIHVIDTVIMPPM